MKQISQEQSLRIVCGIPFPSDANDFVCHLYLFLRAPEFQRSPEKIIINGEKVFYTGQGRFEHARIVAKILWPKAFEWHRWSEAIVGKACESDWLAITGPGASSKSTSIGAYALIWYWCSPLDSAVIVAS